jgi:hypothetical protein
MYRAFIILLLIALAGCESVPYSQTKDGKFAGALDVRWIQNDYFLFQPNKDEPFTFIRSDGSTIRPGPMYTDGGSIPKFMWGVEGYSPWGYAPAYIVHDWLFEARHCGYAPDNKFSFDDSVSIMAESLKAVMEQTPEFRNYFVFDTVVAAIGSPIAKKLWENGSCKPPSFGTKSTRDRVDTGELIMTIKFK